MEFNDKKPDLKAQLLQRLHNPVQLRACLTVAVLLAGYVGIYTPFSSAIEKTLAKLAEAQKRLTLVRDIEHLRAQVDNFQHRLPKQTDPNEWVQYVLSGIRKFPLKLVTLDTDPIRNMGPYKAVVLRIELEGSFPDMDTFLGWLESNERLFRVDSVKIAPHRSNNGTLVMQLTVLGLMGS